MLRINQCKVNVGYTINDVQNKVAKLLRISPKEILHLYIRKESLDARKKPELFYSLSVDVIVNQEDKVWQRCNKKDVTRAEDVRYQFVITGTKEMKKRPVVIGAGPAGLVCAYYLAKYGYRPILLERGKCVEERIKDVELFWEKGIMNPTSNVQFGEGGAGTFSDGKLNTLIKDKDGRCREILELFSQMGAPEDIVYKQKPHVGTDLLMNMVKNMRCAIEQAGGEVRFQSQVTNIILQDGKVTGLVINEGEEIEAEQVVLAIGHSARDTFYMLYERGIRMSPKAFAVGYRLQHQQGMIDRSQYGEQSDEMYEKLGSASYKLTAKTQSGRGVYSFCMCPGGYVVNASSEPGKLAINGMSYRARDSKMANSAIIVSVSPEDFSDKSPLGGVEFQRELEEKAYRLADGKIPVQRFGDFKENRTTTNTEELSICCKGLYQGANLRDLLPKEAETAFLEGMQTFGKRIKGFDEEDVILAGVESRTSSPIRITRDETGNSSILGIYPCGEGAGYAGGITSAAMDGLGIAEKIAKEFSPIKSR